VDDASGRPADFLTQDEIKNLTISKGTLTHEEPRYDQPSHRCHDQDAGSAAVAEASGKRA